MSTILVTGGCGFIGSHLLRYLLDAEPQLDVITLDALTYAGSRDNIADLLGRSRFRFFQGDVADPGVVARCMRGVSSVIHLAAETHVDRSIDNASRFTRTNILGTQVLLDAARVAGVSRFIQVSTDEVYGSLGPSGKFTERSPLRPNSPYAASKAAADLLVRSYVKTHGFPAIITRCSNNYGPRQFPEKLIPSFITRLLRNETVPLYGDGLNVRDWLHVRDHCSAIHRVWRFGSQGTIYNIGADNEWTNLELTHLLLRILDKPVTLIRRVADRPGHDRRYAVDSSRIRRLGWRPTVAFEEGLAETARWYARGPVVPCAA